LRQLAGSEIFLAIHVFLERLPGAAAVERPHRDGHLADEAPVVAQVVAEEILHTEQRVGVGAALARLGHELLRHGVVDLELGAFLVDARQVSEPGGDAQREAADGTASLDLLGDGRDDELRELSGPAETDTGDLVFERRVGKACDERVDVVVNVDAGDLREQRLDLEVHHIDDVLGEERRCDDFVDVVEAGKVGHVAPVQYVSMCALVCKIQGGLT